MAVCPYIECGKVINTHGCRGTVKLESWCNTPKDLASLKQVFFLSDHTYRAYEVEKASVLKQFVLMDLKSVDTMDLAMALKGLVAYARREDFSLAEGEYFLADLIGLDLIDAENGTVYGQLKEVINRGASDIYVADTPFGERMMPAVSEFLDHVDLSSGIYVRPIPGMLD